MVSLKTTLIYVFFLVKIVLCWNNGGHMVLLEIARQDIIQNNPKLLEFANDILKAKFPKLSFIEIGSLQQIAKDMNDEDETNDMADYFKQTLEDISSGDLSAEENSLKLAVLMNLIGDLHQPLLQGKEIVSNQQKISLPDETTTSLLRFFENGFSNFKDYIVPLSEKQQQEITQIASEFMATYPRSGLVERLNFKNPSDWAMESEQIAMNFIFPYFQETTVVTKDWSDMTYFVIKEIISVGGYRLADLVGQISSKPEEPPVVEPPVVEPPIVEPPVVEPPVVEPPIVEPPVEEPNSECEDYSYNSECEDSEEFDMRILGQDYSVCEKSNDKYEQCQVK